MMVMLGTDAHKRSHTIVAVDPANERVVWWAGLGRATYARAGSYQATPVQ